MIINKCVEESKEYKEFTDIDNEDNVIYIEGNHQNKPIEIILYDFVKNDKNSSEMYGKLILRCYYYKSVFDLDVMQIMSGFHINNGVIFMDGEHLTNEYLDINIKKIIPYYEDIKEESEDRHKLRERYLKEEQLILKGITVNNI